MALSLSIDTKGTCLFCLNPNSVPIDRSKLDLTTTTSFKMLFRYLNIDLRKVSSDSLSNGIFLDESSHLGASLCDTCFFLVDEFVELFRDFERIRLKLEACTWKLHGFMETGAKDENRVREYQRRVEHSRDKSHSKFVEELRRKTFEKCSGKRFSSMPKVRLRSDSINMQGTVSEPPNTSEAEPTAGEGSGKRFSSMPKVQLRSGGTINMVGSVSEPPTTIEAEPTTGEGTANIKLAQIKIEVEDNLQLQPSEDQVCHKTKSQPQRRKQCLTPRPLPNTPEIEMHIISSSIPVLAPELPPKQNMLVDRQKCSKCGMRFIRTSTLIRHYRYCHVGVGSKKDIHQKKSKFLKCVYCSTYLSNRSSLRGHQFLMHPVQMLSASLPASTSEEDLKSVVDSIFASAKVVSDAQNSSEFTCPLCSKIFPIPNSSTKLRVHIVTKHVDKICEGIQRQKLICSKVEIEGAGIAPVQQVHIIKASKKLSVTCDICGRRFPYMKYLKSHKYRIHTPGSFKCQFCPKTFLLNKTLQRHLRVVHLEMLNLSSTFSCNYCDKVYPSKMNLKRHLEVKHIFHFCRTGIPPSVSEHVLESAMVAIEEKIRPVEGGAKDYQRGKCVFCGKMVRCAATELRVHIVRNHMEKVIENAKAFSTSADNVTEAFIHCKNEYPSLIPSVEEEDERAFDNEGDGEEHSFAGEDPLGI